MTLLKTDHNVRWQIARSHFKRLLSFLDPARAIVLPKSAKHIVPEIFPSVSGCSESESPLLFISEVAVIKGRV